MKLFKNDPIINQEENASLIIGAKREMTTICRISITSINPKSQKTIFIGSGMIRILNRSGKTVPAELISRVAGLAKTIHAGYKSDKPMHEYARGACHVSSLAFCSEARAQLPALNSADVIRGWDVPGSDGYLIINHEKCFSGLHHLSVLFFGRFSILVDLTPSQLHQALPEYKKTEALIVICELDRICETLRDIYKGGKWGEDFYSF